MTSKVRNSWLNDHAMANLSEADIIQRYFANRQNCAAGMLGIGDDAALFTLPDQHQLVTSIDTLLEGRHFFKTVEPFDLGHKSLAVSISDMAAMGAKPFNALLSLSLPQYDHDWLQAFTDGFFALADEFSITLIGGDLTCGSLSVTTVVNGIVPTDKALRRSGANVGDSIYVTGTLGDAGFALQCLNNTLPVARELLLRLTRPTPRVAAGLRLRNFASSAMDISDGLLLDLSKLCRASGVAGRIELEWLPLSLALQKEASQQHAHELALTAGDDYELLFTVPAHLTAQLEKLNAHVPFTRIGQIVSGEGVSVFDAVGKPLSISKLGYDHFL